MEGPKFSQLHMGDIFSDDGEEFVSIAQLVRDEGGKTCS